MGEQELELLSNIILRKLREEFSVKHLSGNLINTIQIEKSADEIKISIPAQTYNMLLYQEKGVVVHTSHGSYASKIDEEGSSFMVYPNDGRKGAYRVYPRNHKGYVDKVINSAIQEWTSLIGRQNVEKVEG